MYRFLFLTAFLSVAAAVPPDTIHPGMKEFDRELLSRYAGIVDALADGNWEATRGPAGSIASLAADWLSATDTHNRYYPHVERLRSEARSIAHATREKEVRDAFSRLSNATIAYVNQSLPLKEAWNRFGCARVGGFNEWLQPASETKVRNPYLGAAGAECANLKPWRRGLE